MKDVSLAEFFLNYYHLKGYLTGCFSPSHCPGNILRIFISCDRSSLQLVKREIHTFFGERSCIIYSKSSVSVILKAEFKIPLYYQQATKALASISQSEEWKSHVSYLIASVIKIKLDDIKKTNKLLASNTSNKYS